MTPFVQHMGINHDSSDVLMPKHFLESPDIVAGFEQMGGKGMPKSVTGGALDDARLADRILDRRPRGGRVVGDRTGRLARRGNYSKVRCSSRARQTWVGRTDHAP